MNTIKSLFYVLVIASLVCVTPAQAASTTTFRAWNGTLANPPFTFFSDPNTGWYRYLDGHIGVVANGQLAFIMTRSGSTSAFYGPDGASLFAMTTAGAITLNASGTNQAIVLAGSGTGATNIKGTGTNDSASAGNVGEIIATVVGSGSAVSLTTGTQPNIASISLTAGDWDVNAIGVFQPQAATVRTRAIVGISSSSGTLPATQEDRATVAYASADAAANGYTVVSPVRRFNLSSTTTVYMVVLADFSGGTQTAYGTIRARRIR